MPHTQMFTDACAFAQTANMLDAVRTVLEGGRHVTKDVTPTRPRSIDGVPIDVLGLTQRQSEVMVLLAQGNEDVLFGTAHFPRCEPTKKDP